ncbi:MAG: hypothetical protein KDA22_01550 [Phycisphaerales bacterium]|nr:hypothetical protein [Phycisphaerales bacterium]
MASVSDALPTLSTQGADASAWLVVAVVVAGAGMVAWFLRIFRVPGARLLAGIIVGVALGPTVLGRVAPAPWERMVIGGSAERMVLQARQTEWKAWQLARGHVGVRTGESHDAEQEARSAAIAQAETAWRQAVAEHQRPLGIAVLLLAGVVGGTAALGRPADRGASGPTAISIGLWSAGLPVLLGLVVLWWRRALLPAPSSLAVLAALAVGAWGLNAADRRAAGQTGRDGPALIRGASAVATLIAVGLLLTSLFRASATTSDLRHWLGLVGAAAVGWAGLVVLRRSAARLGTAAAPPEDRGPSHPLVRIVEMLAMPALAGLVALQADWIADFSLWIVVGAVIASGDGRWTGAWIGGMLSGGRRPRDAARLALGACGSGPLQVAIAAIAVDAGLFPREWTVAILFGAVATDLTAPVRRRFAQIME